jgi:rubrerythrin
MGKTDENLQAAFDGESQANRKYLFFAEKPIYVCQFCGNTVVGEAPQKCPVCGAPRRMFKLID